MYFFGLRIIPAEFSSLFWMLLIFEGNFRTKCWHSHDDKYLFSWISALQMHIRSQIIQTIKQSVWYFTEKWFICTGMTYTHTYTQWHSNRRNICLVCSCTSVGISFLMVNWNISHNNGAYAIGVGTQTYSPTDYNAPWQRILKHNGYVCSKFD